MTGFDVQGRAAEAGVGESGDDANAGFFVAGVFLKSAPTEQFRKIGRGNLDGFVIMLHDLAGGLAE